MKLKLFVIFIAVLLGLYSFFSFPPTVSVVMATWNRKAMTHEAIESILNQTYRDFEFIIIDDASTDGTAEIVEGYAKKDKRIIFVRNSENKGLVHNLNKGLDMARGKYIARMDDDDISFPERFEKQIAFLEANPETTVLGTWVSPVGKKKPYWFHRTTNPDRFKLELYLGELGVSHPSIMIRRDFLEKHNIRYSEEYKFVEDRHFYANIIKNGGRIHSMPKVLLHYRYLESSKPVGYLWEQQQNTLRFHANLFLDVLSTITPEQYKKMSRCKKLHLIQQINDEKNLIDEEALNSCLQYYCRKNKKKSK